MTETSADLPPAVRAVLDAAIAWERTGLCDVDTWGKEERALADAVRALTPPPAPGPYLDNHGQLVEIGRLGVRWADDGGRWVMWDGAQKYGPFTRLVPMSDVAELTARLSALATAAHIDHRATFGGHVMDECPAPSCVETSALLARFEEASR